MTKNIKINNNNRNDITIIKFLFIVFILICLCFFISYKNCNDNLNLYINIEQLFSYDINLNNDICIFIKNKLLKENVLLIMKMNFIFLFL